VIAAVVSDPAAPTASIYVRALSTARLTGLAGTYQVYFKSGTDWDGQALKFTRDCAFQKFDDSFDANSDWTTRSPLLWEGTPRAATCRRSS
jgi:hypothetical protein